MKIGILTHHYVSNYGAFLQAYALTEAVAKAFPNDTVEIIDYINVKQFVINTGGWFRFYKNRESFICWREKIRVPITFAQARKRYLIRSRKCYTIGQVNKMAYDIIVVGSDEVWNYRDKRSMARIKYGHGLRCKNIIAYAPSVGNSEGDIPQFVQEGIKKFFALSARDEKTCSMLRSITGKEPPRVVDPTFLSAFPKSNKRIKKPYILFYYCDRLPDTVKTQILDYARSHGLSVYGAGECDKRYSDITVNLTPFEWVDMFRNAEFVFTGTFHGAVFSILNHRQFKVYLTNKSRIEKVRSLLAGCSLQNREICDGFVFDLENMNNEIDYQAVDALLEKQRIQSMKYLCGAIEHCRAK